ncbi:MAG: hypothetical protein WDN72_04630 [Alphaproteobacteria bacterium]
MDLRQQINSILSELKLLQSIPPSWRLPLAGGAIFVVILLVTIVLTVRSELPDTEESKPVVMAPIQAPPAPAAASPVIDLFSPSDRQAADQRRTTAVTEQIDNILLSTFILVHCKKQTSEDYSDIYQLLISFSRIQGLAHNYAEGDALVRKRAESVGGSFSMLYGNTDCDNDREMQRMLHQLDAWRHATRLAPVKQL